MEGGREGGGSDVALGHKLIERLSAFIISVLTSAVAGESDVSEGVGGGRKCDV